MKIKLSINFFKWDANFSYYHQAVLLFIHRHIWLQSQCNHCNGMLRARSFGILYHSKIISCGLFAVHRRFKNAIWCKNCTYAFLLMELKLMTYQILMHHCFFFTFLFSVKSMSLWKRDIIPPKNDLSNKHFKICYIFRQLSFFTYLFMNKPGLCPKKKFKLLEMKNEKNYLVFLFIKI